MSAQAVDLDVLDELVIDLRDPRPELRVVQGLGLDIEVPAPAYRRWLKPAFDRTVAALLLLVLLPVLVAIALTLRVRLGKGILFRQERVGLGGTPFTVYKFRTMLPDRRGTRTAAAQPWDGVDRRVTHKTVADPRHTRVGLFLRRWSLDELPQLFNVLRGEMSLVGPRPELPAVVARYQPWEHARHAVRPGLTGFWQTTARAEGPMHDYTYLDLEYVKSISFGTDLRLLLSTPFAAFGSQKGC